MSNQAQATVAGEIEDVYVEIGRMLVQSAVAQAQAADVSAEEGFEATIAIRVVFDIAGTEQRPVACCICTRDTEGVWICAGPCCPVGGAA